MKLTLIRHAPTIYSKKGLFMGALDIPATPESLKDAARFGYSIADIKFNKYISSPLSRAVQTAQAIFPEAQFEIEEDLRERALGVWSGMSEADVLNEFPNAFLMTGFIDPYFTPPEGESIDSLIKRVERFVSRLKKLPNTEHVVAVTHNGIIRLIRCLLENKPIQDMFLAPEGYLVPRTYLYNNLGEWQVTLLNK
jgi:broad specificity phosphatase PhoE